jgi:transglutaminase-like putative cysteine protease
MRSNSLFSLVFASVLVVALADNTFAQTTYAVVSPASTTYAVVSEAPFSSVAPLEAPKPAAITKPILPEPTTFATSGETLAPNSYQAMFRVDAFTVLNQVASFEASHGEFTMTPDEISLFQDMRSGYATHFSFAEAALITSGVHDAAQRQTYLAQIDEITAGSRDAIANCKTTRAKARAIMRYLLKGPMKGGYVHGQTLLNVLLDTGTFNCVSSATLFNIVCRRLGIEVGAVSQPGHIFSRIPGYDVQTTSGSVYSSDQRVEHVRKMMEEFHHQLGGYNADRPYHETSDFGLLGATYGNVASDEAADNDNVQGLVDILKKSSLDPTDPNAGLTVSRRFLALFNSSLKAHDINTAAAIANLYRQIARDPSAAEKMAQRLANAGAHLASR